MPFPPRIRVYQMHYFNENYEEKKLFKISQWKSTTLKPCEYNKIHKNCFMLYKTLFYNWYMKWLFFLRFSVLGLVGFFLFPIGSHRVVCYHGNLAWRTLLAFVRVNRQKICAIVQYAISLLYSLQVGSDNRQFFVFVFLLSIFFFNEGEQQSFLCQRSILRIACSSTGTKNFISLTMQSVEFWL